MSTFIWGKLNTLKIDLDIFLDVVNLIDVVHNNEEENIYRRRRDSAIYCKIWGNNLLKY